MRILRNIFLTVLWAGLLSCATGSEYIISEQNCSVSDIRKAVLATIGEPRTVSENERVYFSRYFSRKPDPKFDPKKSKERLFAKILILGDRRPYDISVEVIAEKLANGTYEESGFSAVDAKKLGVDLKKKLHQSLEGRNVIDDFRPF